MADRRGAYNHWVALRDDFTRRNIFNLAIAPKYPLPVFLKL